MQILRKADRAFGPRSRLARVEGGYLSYAVLAPARRSISISRSCARISARMRVISLRTQSSFYSALRSSGTSPNFRITFASPKSLVAGSPVRLKATAPTQPRLRDSASPRITAAFGLKHSTASAGAMPSPAATNGSAT
jgi:hypothetical protein